MVELALLSVIIGWPVLLKSLSPIRISPQEDDESEDESDEAVDDEADVMPEAFEQSKAVEANDDRGEQLAKDEDRLAACC